MSEPKGKDQWCYVANEHCGHETRRHFVTGEQLRCAGVTRDEAAVLVSASGLDRDDARRVIVELDKARGEL